MKGLNLYICSNNGFNNVNQGDFISYHILKYYNKEFNIIKHNSPKINDKGLLIVGSVLQWGISKLKNLVLL